MKKFLLTFGIMMFAELFLHAQSSCNSLNAILSHDGKSIYFASDRNDNTYEIYRVDIDGKSNLTRLTNSPDVNKIYFALSTNDSLIVFQGGDYNADAEIFIMKSDGSNVTQLTDNGVFDGWPNFSPDGKTIVFTAWDNSPYPEIFTMNIDGTERTQITNKSGAYWQSEPVYNPSQTKIYFQAGYNADDRIEMMDLDGNNWVDITPDDNSFGDMEFYVRFNNSGSKIVFASTKWVGYNNGSDIVLADSNGANWEQLTSSTNGEYFSFPYFDKSDQVIYYTYMENSNSKSSIYKMNIDGTGSTQVIGCSALGISDYPVDKESLIYPNPASDVLHVNMKSGFTMQIFDLTGKIVFTSNKNENDIKHLAPGVYMVQLINGKNQLIKNMKLVKQ
jgi:TolB protein